MSELPTLTAKQQKFVTRYILNGGNASEAYRFAYDCVGMSNEAINTEASKLLKNPKVSLWIKQFKANAQQTIEGEFKYTVQDAYRELNDLQERCKNSSKTYNVEKGCIDTKCKLAGLMVEKHQISTGNLADVLDQLN